jgi:hypothetical protein
MEEEMKKRFTFFRCAQSSGLIVPHTNAIEKRKEYRNDKYVYQCAEDHPP